MFRPRQREGVSQIPRPDRDDVQAVCETVGHIVGQPCDRYIKHSLGIRPSFLPSPPSLGICDGAKSADGLSREGYGLFLGLGGGMWCVRFRGLPGLVVGSPE